jgi:PAS domain S-box-containing protein
LNSRNNRPEKAAEIGRRVERIAGEKVADWPENTEALWSEEARTLLHELRVHQIELEMENENLRRELAALAAERAEEDVLKGREFLADFLDAILIPVFYKDINGRFQGVNRAFETLFGVTKDEIIGRHVLDIHPHDKAAKLHMAKDRALLAQPGTQVYESRARDKHGVLHDVVFHKATVVNSSGEISGLACAILDITERKRAEAALRKSEQKHRTILQTCMNGFWMADTQARLLEVNETYCRMTGYSAQELLTMRISDLEVNETAEDVAAHNLKIRTQGQDRFETRHRRKDGRIFDVEVSVQYQADEGGWFVSFMRDITERKRAEESLRKNEKKLRTILQTAMDGFWMADLQGQLLEVNETYCRMSGYSAEELLTMSVSDLKADGTDEATAARIRKVRALGEDRFEARHRRKDGSVFDVEIGVQYQPDDGGRLVVFLRDITRRKKAEAELHEANAILKAAMDQSGAGIAIADAPNGMIRYVNEAGLRIRGGDREALVNKIGINEYTATWQMMGLDGRPLQPDEIPLARAILYGETCSRELLFCRAGENRFVLAHAAPITDATGIITAGVVVFVDITEHKRTAETLRILSSRLLTAQEDEQRRIAMELHDQTGQDLSVLKLHLATLKTRLRKDQANLKEAFQKVLTVTDGIIEDVRRLAHGLSPSQLEALGLNAALGALIRNFSEKTGIPIHYDLNALENIFPPETQIVLYRIFQEALTNIYKHARAKSVLIKADRQSNTVFIKIKDDGQGFDPDSYARRDPADVERGMGLSAMELRATMIGAGLKIFSQPGKGTEIILLVPARGRCPGH